jgi:hypothetical protein
MRNALWTIVCLSVYLSCMAKACRGDHITMCANQVFLEMSMGSAEALKRRPDNTLVNRKYTERHTIVHKALRII